MQWFLIILLFFLAYFIIYLQNIKTPTSKNFPKGPKSYIHLLGGIFQTGTEPQKLFLKLREKWGDIFAFDLGPKRLVTLNNYNVIRECFNQIKVCGRHQSPAISLRQANERPHGIMFNPAGKVWSEQRRFLLKKLREFRVQDGIVAEASSLVDSLRLEGKGGRSIIIESLLHGPVLGAFWKAVAGHKDEAQLMSIFDRQESDVKIMVLLYNYPWIFKLVGVLPGFLTQKVSQYIEHCHFYLNFMKKEVELHKESYVENSERDFIDSYLTQMKKERNPESSFFGEKGELNLITVLNDLFLAGAETSSSTLNWGIHLIALNPIIQEKLYKEIHAIVGMDRSVSLEDRSLLPYCEACVLEVLRYGAIVPMSMYEVMEEVNFRGHHFPKGTTLFNNIYACLHDPEYWGDPQVFRPERFLSTDGNSVLKHKAFLPFSTGKRICPGESLGRDTIFLFLTKIVQNFKIYPDPKMDKIPQNVQYNCGITNRPKSFTVIFQDRLEFSI